MRKLVLIMILLCSINFVLAQFIQIERNDGSTHGEKINQISKITFVDETVTDIDGNVYNVVLIGNQYWMAENLKVTKYRNSDAITLVTSHSNWSSTTSGAYCAYNNVESNAVTYGYLYNWYAVNDSRNIAPVGWHVSTDEEWKELEMALGMSQSEADDTGWRGTNEGSKLADRTDLWNDGALENDSEFGISGFAALPAGYRNTNGNFDSMSNTTYFWSATEYSSNYPWYRFLTYNISKTYHIYSIKEYGFSVRCVRD